MRKWARTLVKQRFQRLGDAVAVLRHFYCRTRIQALAQFGPPAHVLKTAVYAYLLPYPRQGELRSYAYLLGEMETLGTVTTEEADDAGAEGILGG